MTDTIDGRMNLSRAKMKLISNLSIQGHDWTYVGDLIGVMYGHVLSMSRSKPLGIYWKSRHDFISKISQKSDYIKIKNGYPSKNNRGRVVQKNHIRHR